MKNPTIRNTIHDSIWFIGMNDMLYDSDFQNYGRQYLVHCWASPKTGTRLAGMPAWAGAWARVGLVQVADWFNKFQKL